jgi:hypothetical protein
MVIQDPYFEYGISITQYFSGGQYEDGNNIE